MILIDAHGADHGTSVEVFRHLVKIKQWCRPDEPNEQGEYPCHILSATVPLRELLDGAPSKRWCQAHGVQSFSSMHERILTLALDWLSYYGGEEEFVTGEEPCWYFGMDYSGIGARRKEPWPEHMTCSACGGRPE